VTNRSSRATVYRTLPLLTESGLVREMDFGKDYKFYDPELREHPNHNHIICQDCDKDRGIRERQYCEN